MTRSLPLAAVLGLMLTLAGHHPASSADRPAAADQPNYVHTVIFYLKKDAPRGADKALIDDAFTLLARIPTVKGIRAGLPAEKATPDVAVKDYQVGLLVLFDDYEGLKTYLDHPDHVKFVEKHLKHVDKVLVYDFVQARK